MQAILQMAVAVILWIVAHKDQIKGVILGIEELMKDAPGASKAEAVRDTIAAGMLAEGKLEGDIAKVWPFVGPTFNKFVAKVKAESTQQTAPGA